VLLSTHIVDDIAQTCPRLAVLADGRVVFAGQTSELSDAARGKVWTLHTGGSPPQIGTIAGAFQQQGGVQYRIVADSAPDPAACPAELTLDDGYMAFIGDDATTTLEHSEVSG